MSEAMALEVLAANVMGSRLNTAFTQTRVRLYGPEKGYTDLDAVAAAPVQKTLAITECKARGPARAVYKLHDYDGLSNAGYCKSLKESAQALFRPSNSWLSKSLQLGSDEAPWSGVERLELWLFANVYVDPEDQDSMNARLAAEIRKDLGDAIPARIAVHARVVSTLDLVLESFSVVERWVTDFDWGVRSGDPVFDAMRELVRYKHARVEQGGRGASPVVKAHFQRRVRQVLLGEPQ